MGKLRNGKGQKKSKKEAEIIPDEVSIILQELQLRIYWFSLWMNPSMMN